jgi:hypothetical protein
VDVVGAVDGVVVVPGGVPTPCLGEVWEVYV